MNPRGGAGEEDCFECLFESALEEERSLSKTLSLPRNSRSSSNACSGSHSMSLSSSNPGIGSHESGDTSRGVEGARESMQDDWKRLLLRMRGPATQQARVSRGCVQAYKKKLAKETQDMKSHTEQDQYKDVLDSPRSKA